MSSRTSVRVFDSPDSLSRAAADFIIREAAAAIAARSRFLLALSGGGTPEPLFRLLASPPYRGRLDWAAGLFFWGDERCVPPTAPGSNYGQAKRLLLDPLGVTERNIYRIKGELPPEGAAADYRQRLANLGTGVQPWPVFDVALMGLGSDGHTASLFPGPPASGESQLAAIAATADYEGRPAERVTLTPPVFNSAKNALFLVSGAAKARAVAAVLEPDADVVAWPAARIRPTKGRLLFFLDRAAGLNMTDHDRALPADL
jgi:6-phosphogluconolactonase